MRKKLSAAGLAFAIAIGPFTATPLLAHEPHHSSDSEMGSGMMGMMSMMGMMGMMGMMEQMNKMMGLCTKMMESGMDGTGGHEMPMPQPAPEAPKQGG